MFERGAAAEPSGLRIARGIVAPTVFVHNAASHSGARRSSLEGVARELGAVGASVVDRALASVLIVPVSGSE